TGCPNPNPQYQFWVRAPGASAWTVVQPYSTSHTFSWSTAGKTPGNYQFAVWARDASSGGVSGNAFGTWDEVSFASYSLTTCTSVGLSAMPASGTTVTFTATASGCPSPSPQYQFWILAPGASSWTLVQTYSISNTFSWNTAGKANGLYYIAVWVRDASSGGAYGNAFGTWDLFNSSAYTLA
ncbi:MAG TPA: hypothetical protein VHO95_09820, partial [Candidatus Dormibacteraeota bacterium]|nr:hypothetical protein [Candidatus Dormibacteraeota bacterium]